MEDKSVSYPYVFLLSPGIQQWLISSIPFMKFKFTELKLDKQHMI